MDILPIDSCIHLTKRLGKAKTDRIRYHQQGTGKLRKRGVNINNPLLDEFSGREMNEFKGVGDILYGVANSYEDSSDRIPLSTTRLFVLFSCLPIINNREIQLLTGLGERQSRRYLQAAKAALPFLIKTLEKLNAHNSNN